MKGNDSEGGEESEGERQEERGHERRRRKAVKSPHFFPSPVVCNHNKGLGTGSHHLLLSLATSGIGEGGRRGRREKGGNGKRVRGCGCVGVHHVAVHHGQRSLPSSLDAIEVSVHFIRSVYCDIQLRTREYNTGTARLTWWVTELSPGGGSPGHQERDRAQ